jgi:hypothetical protein
MQIDTRGMGIIQDMTGCLAPQSEPFEPTPEPVTQKPAPIVKPMRVSDAHWAKIQTEISFMASLEGLSAHARDEKIEDRAEILRRIEYQQPQLDEIAETARQERAEREGAEAAYLAAHPTDAMRIASLEAALIELRVRVATLEDAQPRKPAKVTRISRTAHSTPPDAA